MFFLFCLLYWGFFYDVIVFCYNILMCRINLGIVLLLVLSACAGDSLEPNYTYEDYYKKFNRTYEG